MPRCERIAIVGGGNVARALCRALPAAVRLSSRHPVRVAADLTILAVSDRAIREVSERFDFGGGLVVHTSGSCDWTEISPRVDRRGVFYPLQTFSAGRAVDFSEIPLFIEAENEADLALLERLAKSLSKTVVRSDAPLRGRVHVGAVFVCNFVNALYTAGERWMNNNGLDFNLLKPLIAETSRKMLASASPRDAQTGPAVRGDGPTIEKHRALLRDYPDLQNIYDTLTAYLVEMAEHGKF